MNKKEELLQKINKINLEIKRIKKEEYIKSKKNELKSQKMFLYHLKNIGYDLTKKEDFNLLIGTAFFIRNTTNPKNRELSLHFYKKYNEVMKDNKNK